MPVDTETSLQFQDARNKARNTGQDLVELLNRNELLCTKARRQELQFQGLMELVRRLEKQDPSKLLRYYLGRETGTAAEMFSAMQQWIGSVIQAIAEGRLQEVDDLAERAQRR